MHKYVVYFEFDAGDRIISRHGLVSDFDPTDFTGVTITSIHPIGEALPRTIEKEAVKTTDTYKLTYTWEGIDSSVVEFEDEITSQAPPESS